MKTKLTTALLFFTSLLAAPMAYAGMRVPVHGNLTDAASTPVDGEQILVFELFDATTGGEALFAETHASVNVTDGRFTVYLGAVSDKLLPAIFRDNDSLWLQITVGTDDVLEPRIRMGATPYAGHASYADDATKLNGKSAADYAVAGDLAIVATSGQYTDLSGTPAPYDVDGRGLQLNDSTISLVEADVKGMCVEAIDDRGYVTEAVLSSAGTLNAPSNPVNWTQLRSVPVDLADGDQDTQLSAVQVQNFAVSGGFLRELGVGATDRLAIFDGFGSLTTEGSGSVEIYSDGERVARIANRNDPSEGASPAVVFGYSGNSVAATDASSNAVVAATISGGGFEFFANTVTATGGTIGGGVGNSVSERFATVPGGQHNVADGAHSFAVGNRCTASGEKSFAAGQGATAAGDYAFALGYEAEADANRCFVWGSGLASTQCTYDGADPVDAAYRFVARARGGVHLLTSDANDVGAILPPNSGSWESLSDRNQKRDIAQVDVTDVLKKVAELPMSTWSYKAEDGVRHLGPMAQDFREAFGLGSSDKRISTVDGFGVALAAVQGLERENQALRAEVAELRAENAKQLAEMETRLRSLEAR